MEEINKNPLVSIVVVTYNSSKYVLETLESAKRQTYQNIELIITDDGSKDNTVQLCSNWLSANESRFVRTELITVEKNTGIPANCNRGHRAARGEWVKGIAGDCIKKNVDYVIDHTEVQILFTQAQRFYEKNSKKVLTDIYPGERFVTFSKMAVKDQLITLLGDNQIAAPSCFMKKALYDKFPYDETFPLMEDYNHWITLSLHGIKLYGMNETTVLYRENLDAVSSSVHSFYPKSTFDVQPKYFYLEKKALIEKYAPHLLENEKKKLVMLELTELLLKNKKTPMNKIWFSLLYRFIHLFH
jgi:alpha-1,3-rhamnosyltransferase